MKMGHVTIMTAKMDESIAFYQDVVKLHIVADLRKNGGKPVFLGDDECPVRVELIEDTEHPCTGAPGFSIGFHVKDVDKAREEMAAMGLNPTPFIMPNPHVRFFYVTDPNGLSIQFI